jgi:hypothetical protein
MKIILSLFCALCVIACGLNQLWGAPAAANESVQLKVELRDGSRVVGKITDDTLSIHSSVLGDLKLPWANIRSIEYTGDQGTASLTASNGDVFTVQPALDSLSLETGFGKVELPVKMIRSIEVSAVAAPSIPGGAAAGNESGSRLVIELQDGSHVIGKGLDDTLSLHSSILGDLNLPWTKVRSIIYGSNATNTAQLTETNNDAYAVELKDPVVRVETSFGKTELPVRLIRSVEVSALNGLGQVSSGLVALWAGDGDGDDSIGGHDATVPPGITYAPAPVGQGFCFDGQNHQLIVPNAPELNFGPDQDFSITAWTEPQQSDTGAGVMDIVDKRCGPGYSGFEFYLGNGKIQIQILGATFGPAGPDLRDGRFHHVAVTVHRNTAGGGELYVDGQTVLTFDTTGIKGDLSGDQPLHIGSNCYPNFDTFFKGIMSQLGLYNRALSASDIQTIYEEGGGTNNSPPPPSSAQDPTRSQAPPGPAEVL